MVSAEVLKLVSRVFLSYSLMVLILCIPIVIAVLQWGSGFIQTSTITPETKAQYTQDALSIIISGKIYTTTYTEEEVAHLLDVRQVLFGFFIVSMVVVLLWGYLRLNSQPYSLFHRSALFRAAAIVIALFTVITAIFFTPLFIIFHEIFFPNGNYFFGLDSPLIQAFPPSFWFLEYLVLQIGVVVLLVIQAVYAKRHEV